MTASLFSPFLFLFLYVLLVLFPLTTAYSLTSVIPRRALLLRSPYVLLPFLPLPSLAESDNAPTSIVGGSSSFSSRTVTLPVPGSPSLSCSYTLPGKWSESPQSANSYVDASTSPPSPSCTSITVRTLASPVPTKDLTGLKVLGSFGVELKGKESDGSYDIVSGGSGSYLVAYAPKRCESGGGGGAARAGVLRVRPRVVLQGR